jgi:hypothetical protein
MQKEPEVPQVSRQLGQEGASIPCIVRDSEDTQDGDVPLHEDINGKVTQIFLQGTSYIEPSEEPVEFEQFSQITTRTAMLMNHNNDNKHTMAESDTSTEGPTCRANKGKRRGKVRRWLQHDEDFNRVHACATHLGEMLICDHPLQYEDKLVKPSDTLLNAFVNFLHSLKLGHVLTR